MTQPKDGKAWIWALALGLAIVALLAGVLFYIYQSHLPFISNDHAAWGSFGSLLSAFTTLAGFAITIATLLFLNAQNREQRQFVTWQTKTQTFEQYINHRRLFIERLNELQTSNNNSIRFINPESSYNKTFPKNNPTNLELVVAPEHNESERNLLGELELLFGLLNQHLETKEWQHHDIWNLITTISEISYHLNIEITTEPNDGDISHDDDYIGANIYFLDEGLSRLSGIYNSFLFYTGNPPFVGSKKAGSAHTREALMKFFIERRHPHSGFDVFKKIAGLEDLEKLYFEIKKLHIETERQILPNTLRWLEILLSSKDGFDSLREGTLQMTVLNNGMHECTKALEELHPDNPIYTYLNDLHTRLLNLAIEI